MYSLDAFEKGRDAVEAALKDGKLTTGASIPISPHLLAGNTRRDGPALSPAYIDDFGRIWAERHHGDKHEFVCVLDFGRASIKAA